MASGAASSRPRGPSTSGPSSSSPRPRGSVAAKGGAVDPVLRNALRYTISAKEYATLHKYVLSRSRVLRRAAPSVATVERIVDGPVEEQTSGKGSPVRKAGGDPYNVRAVRDALRVFAGTAAAMKAYDVVTKKLSGKKDTTPKQPLHKSPTLRLSLSLSTILLLYRILFRFLNRLRFHLLEDSALPFRQRNPRTAAALSSPLAPAVGAGLAGLALGVYPAQQMRITLAIMAMFRALEFGWNLCEGEGLVWGFRAGGRVKRERPWWWGSWLLQPLAFGQLLHACVFDRDCFPAAYGSFIFTRSAGYLQQKPAGYPSHIQWPATYAIVDSLAQMAKLNWPPFISPTLFPGKETLPASLAIVAPITSTAHPIITSLSCATLHPTDPSCLRTYLQFWLGTFGPVVRFMLGIYGAFALLSGGATRLYHAPLTALQRILGRALRTSTFITGAISTAWGTICLFQTWFPRHFAPRFRFFLGGFAAGLWAWVERRHGRSVFLYSARTSVDSLWKVGVKRRWWRGMAGGDVWVFALALMVTGVVYERDAKAIREGGWRRGMSWVRGEGFHDWSLEDEEEEEEVEGREKEE
ncbi:hypothetical protein B0T11DRAFT_10122 [Plectosphaerella cucumerina]|uniref:Uncharacterized protein n=1 Tax=Plectosphaerella cucumerina TaxID=40658 RepID=A0A8K0TNH1_9PEZI|nr:hypothetical protein B0T11DRAFT_10122 [Plectosphaerella cucumerina]